MLHRIDEARTRTDANLVEQINDELRVALVREMLKTLSHFDPINPVTIGPGFLGVVVDDDA